MQLEYFGFIVMVDHGQLLDHIISETLVRKYDHGRDLADSFSRVLDHKFPQKEPESELTQH